MYRETGKRFHFFLLGGQSGGMGANCGLHPLIHTLLKLNRAQDIAWYQDDCMWGKDKLGCNLSQSIDRVTNDFPSTPFTYKKIKSEE